jgi:hypothetical protein
MMFKTRDKLINIEGVESVGDIVFHPSDWSVINSPPDPREAADVFTRLYNTPGTNHVSLVVFRQRKRLRLNAFASISGIPGDWNYLDTVSITYQKPSSCSNNGLLPISEVGVLLYKGVSPEVKRTAWFSSGYDNSTNLWDLGLQAEEGDKSLYFQKFSWEMNLLLKSLCGSLEHRAFTYTPFMTASEIKSVYAFCKMYQIRAYLYAKDTKDAEKLIKECN